MKVKDLIKELQALDQEALVIVSGYEGGYEGGYEEVASAEEKLIALNVRDLKPWYYGSHEIIDDDFHKAKYSETRYKLEQAVYLS